MTPSLLRTFLARSNTAVEKEQKTETKAITEMKRYWVVTRKGGGLVAVADTGVIQGET